MQRIANSTPVETTPTGGWRRPFDVWLDGVEAGWAVPALLVGFVAIWTAFAVVAYANAGLHPDTLEAWSVGRFFAWGNVKHPPLMGWIAYLWSAVFPLTDWSFQLLAMVNAGIALWAVDLIARRFAHGDKRVIVLLLLMLMIPTYQFHAQRFNANAVLLAVWPLATYCFLRSFESRTALWSIATGVLCALAMLGKYYSVFLIAGFAFAAIAHPQRWSYVLSRAPWLSMLAGFIALAPHIHWLATTDGLPFEYALRMHGGTTVSAAAQDSAKYLLGIMGYLIAPVLAWFSISRSRVGDVAKDIAHLNPGLLLLALVFLGSIVSPVIVALSAGTHLTPLWSLQGLFFVALILVCSARFPVVRQDTVSLAVAVGIFSIGALLAAPIHAFYRNTYLFKEGRNTFHEASTVLTNAWHDAYGLPLPRVSGDDNLAFAAAFYGADHPLYSRPFRFQGTWGIPRGITLQKGWTALCFAADPACTQWMGTVAAAANDSTRFEFAVASNLWGWRGASTRISAMMVPPLPSIIPDAPVPQPLDDGTEDFSANRRKVHIPDPPAHNGGEKPVLTRVVHRPETP